MDFLVISRTYSCTSWAGQRANLRAATCGSILGGVLEPTGPRTHEATQPPRKTRPHLGVRRGRGVGGNDPGFGRAEPPKTLSARVPRVGGRSRPRLRNEGR